MIFSQAREIGRLADRAGRRSRGVHRAKAYVRVPANPTVTMLGVPGRLARQVAGESLIIATPDPGPDEAPGRHAYTFKIQGGEVLPES